MKHIGDLEINSKNAANYKNLVKVTGSLYISSGVKFEANKLKSVGDYLYISSEAKFEANKLKSVGSYLQINSEAKFEALESVGDYLDISSGAINNFPNNVKIKCLRNITGNIGRMKFEAIDNIACAVLSTKLMDGLIIKKCQKSIFKDGKLIGDQFFVASNDKNNAHGNTIKEAIDELFFKESSRDIEKFRGMPLSTKKAPEEWVLIYRAITGACKLGAEMFVKDKGKLKKYYSLKEILEETKGAYGHDQFVNIIKG